MQDVGLERSVIISQKKPIFLRNMIKQKSARIQLGRSKISNILEASQGFNDSGLKIDIQSPTHGNQHPGYEVGTTRNFKNHDQTPNMMRLPSQRKTAKQTTQQQTVFEQKQKREEDRFRNTIVFNGKSETFSESHLSSFLINKSEY